MTLIDIAKARALSKSMLIEPAMPSRALLVFKSARENMDAYGYVDEHGDPPSAMTTLRRASQMSRSGVWKALMHLYDLDLASYWRVTNEIARDKRGRFRGAATLRVRIHVERLRLTDACNRCGKPADYRERWCGRCFQLFGRDDRHWMIKARDLFAAGKSLATIAVLVNRPMYEARNDDGRDGSGGNAVVAWAVNDPDLAAWPEREAWAARLREMQRGRGIDE